MFVGHYGPSFAIKSVRRGIPLWLLFVAVQLLDFGWAVLVLLGVEKVRIVPGITASNPLDLYYMPYTHGLPGSLAFSLAFGAIVALLKDCTIQVERADSANTQQQRKASGE